MGMTPAPKQFPGPTPFGSNNNNPVLTPAKAAPLAPPVSLNADPLLNNFPAPPQLAPQPEAAPQQAQVTQQAMPSPIRKLAPRREGITPYGGPRMNRFF